MTTRYLLDTNTVSDLVRYPQGVVAMRVLRVGQDRVFTSIVVAAELRYGAARKASARLTTQVESILRAIEIVPFETPADVAYGILRTVLERRGQPIGGNDLLIGAQAITLNATLVTDNEREFARVENLRVENWLKREENPR